MMVLKHRNSQQHHMEGGLRLRTRITSLLVVGIQTLQFRMRGRRELTLGM